MIPRVLTAVILAASFICAVVGVHDVAAQTQDGPRIDHKSLGSLGPAAARLAEPGRVPVFRGRGEAGPGSGEPAFSPRPLGADVLRTIVQSLGVPEPGSLYARVTPSGPEVPGKAALVFVKADVVEGGEGYALFENNDALGQPDLTLEETAVEGYFVLWVRSNANARYLIDCAVSGKYWHLNALQGPEFRVAGPGGNQTFDFRGAHDPDGYHLVFSLVADAPGWFPFQVSTAPAGSAQGYVGGMGPLLTDWRLHSCEVTHL